MTRESLQFLTDKCRSWGGDIKVVTSGDWNELPWSDTGWYESPSATGHGINWPTKTIYVARPWLNSGTVIHEMGHTFLDMMGPGDSDEFTWLGWEIRMSRIAGCYRTWHVQNAQYGLGQAHIPGDTSNLDRFPEWGNLNRRQRAWLEKDRISEGIAIGIIDRDGNPLARR